MSPRRAPRWSWMLAAGGVVIRPGLWGIALRSFGRLARPAWWRRLPFLPIPDRAYLRFRLETQYGADGAPAPGDLATYLRWCRAQDAVVRRGRA